MTHDYTIRYQVQSTESDDWTAGTARLIVTDQFLGGVSSLDEQAVVVFWRDWRAGSGRVRVVSIAEVEHECCDVGSAR